MNGKARARAIKNYKSIIIILNSEGFMFSRDSKKQAELKKEAVQLKIKFNL